jgi:hypothetical protein
MPVAVRWPVQAVRSMAWCPTLTVRVPADLEDELDSVGPIRVSEVQHARCER